MHDNLCKIFHTKHTRKRLTSKNNRVKKKKKKEREERKQYTPTKNGKHLIIKYS